MYGKIEIATGNLVSKGGCADMEVEDGFEVVDDVPTTAAVVGENEVSPEKTEFDRRESPGVYVKVPQPELDFELTGLPAVNVEQQYRNPAIGLHEEVITDDKGDIVEINLYKEYDPQTKEFSRLAVKEERVITREPTFGLPIAKKITSKFYRKGGALGVTKEETKYPSETKAIKFNERSREMLIEEQKGWLLKHPDVGYANGIEFLEDVNQERDLYIQGVRSRLIDAINNSTRPYMTQEVKDHLTEKLDIAYE